MSQGCPCFEGQGEPTRKAACAATAGGGGGQLFGETDLPLGARSEREMEREREIHTHTHTHIYIYIYIYREREREIERERCREGLRVRGGRDHREKRWLLRGARTRVSPPGPPTPPTAIVSGLGTFVSRILFVSGFDFKSCRVSGFGFPPPPTAATHPR